MDNLIIRAALAGACFGAWPLFLSKSGLGGNVSSLALLLGTIVFVIPFAYLSMSAGPQGLLQAKWTMVFAGSLFSACGLLLFNSMLAQATPENRATLFVLAVLVQACVPAIYDLLESGKLTLVKLLGFVFAAIGAALLTRATN